MQLSYEGICPCGGRLTASEWTTKTHRKGRTTCEACGRTELKQRELKPEEKEQFTSNHARVTI